MAIAEKSIRKELGDFSSVVCFKHVITGVEEALGDKAAAIAFIMAGRKRGQALCQQLGLAGKGENLSLDEVAKQLNQALGTEGTRLCMVDKIEQEGDTYSVYTKETICSAGEEEGSPRSCTYTLGAIQGFLECLLNKRFRGKQTDSVLRGADYDVLTYSILA